MTDKNTYTATIEVTFENKDFVEVSKEVTSFQVYGRADMLDFDVKSVTRVDSEEEDTA